MTGIPLRIGRTRVAGALKAFCGAAVTLSAVWAAWPIAAEREPPVEPEAGGDAKYTVTALASLDLDAFRVPIWIAPPPAAVPEKPAPPPPPLKLQLLAIIREEGTYKAALYDPDADKVLVVAAGESLGAGRAVEVVTESAVSVRDGRGVRTLALREEGKP